MSKSSCNEADDSEVEVLEEEKEGQEEKVVEVVDLEEEEREGKRKRGVEEDKDEEREGKRKRGEEEDGEDGDRKYHGCSTCGLNFPYETGFKAHLPYCWDDSIIYESDEEEEDED
jgi:hypothetical protein